MSEDNIQSPSDQNIKEIELSALPVFSDLSKSCVNQWMDKMNKGILSLTHFKEHWRVWVPKIYSPEPNGNCLDWSFDEEKAQKILYNTLEEFICNGDPQVVLKQLSKMDNPPSVCGKVFKIGEPTYSCRECGMDFTCVLCVECFKQSAHRNHKYKMGSSNVGGCCDCGDIEAWKKEPFCKIHAVGVQSKETQGNKLPDDIAARAAITFEAVLRYCYEMLSLKHTSGLPSDLCIKGTDEDPLFLLTTTETYCTVLFNDEIHTFEQVINTLTRVLKCSQRDAVEYVTNVDREGRSIVKCSGFQHCNELKAEIERYTSRNSNKALKVLVLHVHVIAHQTFAMKLLNWLQQFISLCEGFRITFSNVVLSEKSEKSIVEDILIKDSQLWKSARTAWHRLFISGMLMEYESKKALAIVFTQNYSSVMKGFIRDDHDHSFSIVSLSVQLFTVPTLAHHLIAHHNALFLLLNTFISEISRRCNSMGILEFERNIPNISFKRAQYIIYDLRYLLSVKPDVWTDELRRNFLYGISSLLVLFESMQCMDAVQRQVGQHMEYEPEWESAFNLHIKLSPVISLALEWCGSDRIVLTKAFRLVLQKLQEQPGLGPGQVKELVNYNAACLQYDVSCQLVSIHLPLSRFLAGLFLQLGKTNIHLQCFESAYQTKLAPHQMIEPVLRAQAMISQVHAGMWRRNGYSLLNQLYFYHNVKCRSEMLDRDIILLQAGATLIESNKFLIHILNKFNLLNWANPNFEINALKNPEEDSIRYTTNLVEEFLCLLITIIGERHVPGVGRVTADDHLKKEIIQQLCIKPLSHSELNKTLPNNVHFETGMERVIHEVADFKKPPNSSAGKGVYELKPHLYSEYNVFFYHYTKEELSRSEEAQRKRRKALGELECCPPPKLPRLTEVFTFVVNLLQCDIMLHIMETVLERALQFVARSFSEPQVHKVLHLIGYALQEQESGYYPFFAFTEKAAKWKIYKLLERLQNSPRIEAHKDLLTWVLAKYVEVAGSTVTESTSSTVATTENASDAEANKNGKEWRTKMAALKRSKIMAQMTAMQTLFMKKNAKLFETTALDANKSSDRGSAMDLTECAETSMDATGNDQSIVLPEEKTYTCILCQEDQTVTATGPVMVLAAFVQQSTVLCQHRGNTEEPDPLYLSAKLGASPHTSTCGHVMHAHCWQEYFDNVLAKENRRPYRLRAPTSFDVEKQEYICPLCECLSNTVLPLLPPLAVLQPRPRNQPELTFEMWLEAMRLTINCKSNARWQKTQSFDMVHDPACLYYAEDEETLTTGSDNPSEQENLACPIKTICQELGPVGAIFESTYTQSGPTLLGNLVTMIHVFTQATYTKGFGAELNEADPRVPLLAWKSTAYTVHAIEFLLRDMDKPLLGALSSRQRDCLEGLARISAILGAARKCRGPARTVKTWADKTTIGNHALSLLTILLKNPHEGPSVLEWDPLGILIPLINSLPTLFNPETDAPPPIITGGIFEMHALTLVFLSLIVKIILTTDFDESMDVDSQETEEFTSCSAILPVVQALGVNIVNEVASELWRRVKEACLPFLRCYALYYHFISDVPAPEELTKVGGDTYENICAYLGLPTTCNELLGSKLDSIMQLVEVWKSHPTVQAHLSGASPIVIIKEPLKVNKLVELPEDYSELINTISLFTCPNSDREDSRNPTMCLVCGEMLCSQSYCCQTELNKTMVGACTYHASKCGIGIGMFLRVRECEILFLKCLNRGSFIAPPYLDEYGETDQGLRRGNPLRLCKEKYRELNQMWLGHGLHEAVARAIELSNNLIATQWLHL